MLGREREVRHEDEEVKKRSDEHGGELLEEAWQHTENSFQFRVSSFK